jgi:hypothetical protein
VSGTAATNNPGETVLDNLYAIGPVIGVYLFVAVCFCLLIGAWIWWEDRNDDGGTNNE